MPERGIIEPAGDGYRFFFIAARMRKPVGNRMDRFQKMI